MVILLESSRFEFLLVIFVVAPSNRVKYICQLNGSSLICQGVRGAEHQNQLLLPTSCLKEGSLYFLRQRSESIEGGRWGISRPDFCRGKCSEPFPPLSGSERCRTSEPALTTNFYSALSR